MPIHNSIIERLKTGTVKNVVLFADSMKVPSLPYVVVKPETGVIANTRQYRIIIHYQQGMADDLETYTMVEIDKLLPGTIDDGKHRYKLYKCGYTDITVEPHDDTLFMERIFYTPLPGYQN
jgi:hypothetical protein